MPNDDATPPLEKPQERPKLIDSDETKVAETNSPGVQPPSKNATNNAAPKTPPAPKTSGKADDPKKKAGKQNVAKEDDPPPTEPTLTRSNKAVWWVGIPLLLAVFALLGLHVKEMLNPTSQFKKTVEDANKTLLAEATKTTSTNELELAKRVSELSETNGQLGEQVKNLCSQNEDLASQLGEALNERNRRPDITIAQHKALKDENDLLNNKNPLSAEIARLKGEITTAGEEKMNALRKKAEAEKEKTDAEMTLAIAVSEKTKAEKALEMAGSEKITLEKAKHTAEAGVVEWKKKFTDLENNKSGQPTLKDDLVKVFHAIIENQDKRNSQLTRAVAELQNANQGIMQQLAIQTTEQDIAVVLFHANAIYPESFIKPLYDVLVKSGLRERYQKNVRFGAYLAQEGEVTLRFLPLSQPVIGTPPEVKEGVLALGGAAGRVLQFPYDDFQNGLSTRDEQRTERVASLKPMTSIFDKDKRQGPIGAGKLQRRLVLVVSDESDPPENNDEWKSIDVDVIFSTRREKHDAARHDKWLKFSRDHRGLLLPLTEATAKGMDPSLLTSLFRRLVQPQ